MKTTPFRRAFTSLRSWAALAGCGLAAAVAGSACTPTSPATRTDSGTATATDGRAAGGAGGANAAGGAGGFGGASGQGGSPGNGGSGAGGGLGGAAGVAPRADGGAPPDAPGTGGIVVNGGVGAGSFHCVNWADNRDNFVDGDLLLSGITSDTDTYDGVKTKATLVLGAFVDLLRANSFRMPINEPTVLGAWWSSYKAIIDVGIAKGMKVVISFWAKDKNIGMPADVTRFYSMWQVVVDAYGSNPLVYFDVHNEPHGYTPQQWITQVNDWIKQFPTVPRRQIIVAGSGWDDNVANVAGSFPDLLLELHDYAFNDTTKVTEQAWRTDVTSRLGSGAPRTIVGEWGAAVRGEDYSAPINGDNQRAFVTGVADQIHDSNMGSCWWPGLWAVTGNISSWSLLNMAGTANNLTFSIQSQTVLDKIWHSWALQ